MLEWPEMAVKSLHCEASEACEVLGWRSACNGMWAPVVDLGNWKNGNQSATSSQLSATALPAPEPGIVYHDYNGAHAYIGTLHRHHCIYLGILRHADVGVSRCRLHPRSVASYFIPPLPLLHRPICPVSHRPISYRGYWRLYLVLGESIDLN
jgi:hypothetical protein